MVSEERSRELTPVAKHLRSHSRLEKSRLGRGPLGRIFPRLSTSRTPIISFEDLDPPDRCSIVAIHGLNPWGNQNHAYDTWTKPEGNGTLWLRDLLPSFVPNARAFLYEYNSRPAFGASKLRFIEHANSLLESIHLKRTNVSGTVRRCQVALNNIN